MKFVKYSVLTVDLVCSRIRGWRNRFSDTNHPQDHRHWTFPIHCHSMRMFSSYSSLVGSSMSSNSLMHIDSTWFEGILDEDDVRSVSDWLTDVFVLEWLRLISLPLREQCIMIKSSEDQSKQSFTFGTFSKTSSSLEKDLSINNGHDDSRNIKRSASRINDVELMIR